MKNSLAAWEYFISPSTIIIACMTSTRRSSAVDGSLGDGCGALVALQHNKEDVRNRTASKACDYRTSRSFRNRTD